MVVKCDLCPYTLRTNSEIKRHKLQAHSDIRPFKCSHPGCPFGAKTKMNLKIHQRTHETNLERRKPYPCPVKSCDYRATHLNSLNVHLEARHTPGRTKRFKCPLCPSQTYTRRGLDIHIQFHTAEKKYKCDSCDYRSHQKRIIVTHMESVHKKSVQFKCEFPNCIFSSAYRTALKRHQEQRHESNPLVQRPLPCCYPGCEYRAPVLTCLRRHEQCHNTQRTKEFQCALCLKSFYDHRALTFHISNVHTREKTYNCDDCKFKTTQPRRLADHRLSFHSQHSTGNNWLTCDICGYSTHRKRLMNNHKLAAHNEERKFSCDRDDCNFKTNYANSLRYHVLTH